MVIRKHLFSCAQCGRHISHKTKKDHTLTKVYENKLGGKTEFNWTFCSDSCMNLFLERYYKV